jgi:hypothetical protein
VRPDDPVKSSGHSRYRTTSPSSSPQVRQSAALLALAAFATSVMCQRAAISVVAAAIVAATLAIRVPCYFFGQRPVIGERVDIRVLLSNLRKGWADALRGRGQRRRCARRHRPSFCAARQAPQGIPAGADEATWRGTDGIRRISEAECETHCPARGR